MAFKLFSRKMRNSDTLEKGQEWKGESVEENLASCEYEGCGRVFENYFPKEGWVLEAGCGLGRWVLDFSRRGYKIIGCEIDHQAVKKAKRFDPSASFITADIRSMPFKNEIFDAILSLGVIEHFKGGPQKVLEEKKRILKPEGILLVAVPYNNLFRKVLVNRFISLKVLIMKALKYNVVFTEHRYSKKELMDLLESSGFEILSCYPEMLLPPKHVGAYVDYIHLTGRIPENKFDVPKPMRVLTSLMKSISPWLISGMVLCAARKKT